MNNQQLSPAENQPLGAPFDTRSEEQIRLFHKAKGLLLEFNQLNTYQSDRKQQILLELLGWKGKNAWIEGPFFCDYGQHIFLGDHSIINMNCVFIDVNQITIGSNVLIGPAVQVYTAMHPLRVDERVIRVDADTVHYRTFSQPVSIGDNAWIGGGAIIMPGVTIGSNAIIGAGSVVTHDVPDGMIAMGNPCKVTKASS